MPSAGGMAPSPMKRELSSRTLARSTALRFERRSDLVNLAGRYPGALASQFLIQVWSGLRSGSRKRGGISTTSTCARGSPSAVSMRSQGDQGHSRVPDAQSDFGRPQPCARSRRDRPQDQGDQPGQKSGIVLGGDGSGLAAPGEGPVDNSRARKSRRPCSRTSRRKPRQRRRRLRAGFEARR